MSHLSYYNDIDHHACEWITQLIFDGLIPPGVVDTRSITNLDPDELRSFTQCHFFCGIAGWPLALSMAGVPPTRRIWSGSAPCQPFSVGNVAHGGGKGMADARHLAPVFVWLISQCRPPVVIGEQVAAAVGKQWWDQTACELEGCDYACGAAVLPACAYGAEHERKRLFWGAYASSAGWEGHQPLQFIPESAPAAFAFTGHHFAHARRALDGDFGDLLHSNGVSLQLERLALKGYGNAISPPVAAEFIQAFLSVIP